MLPKNIRHAVPSTGRLRIVARGSRTQEHVLHPAGQVERGMFYRFRCGGGGKVGEGIRELERRRGIDVYNQPGD